MYPYIEVLECTVCKRTPDKWIIKKEGSKILPTCATHGETIIDVKKYLDGRKEESKWKHYYLLYQSQSLSLFR